MRIALILLLVSLLPVSAFAQTLIGNSYCNPGGIKEAQATIDELNSLITEKRKRKEQMSKQEEEIKRFLDGDGDKKVGALVLIDDIIRANASCLVTSSMEAIREPSVVVRDMTPAEREAQTLEEILINDRASTNQMCVRTRAFNEMVLKELKTAAVEYQNALKTNALVAEGADNDIQSFLALITSTKNLLLHCEMYPSPVTE